MAHDTLSSVLLLSLFSLVPSEFMLAVSQCSPQVTTFIDFGERVGGRSVFASAEAIDKLLSIEGEKGKFSTSS